MPNPIPSEIPSEVSPNAPNPPMNDGLLLVSLPDAVLFPGAVVKVEVRSVALLDAIAAEPEGLVAVFGRKAMGDPAAADPMFDLGVTADPIFDVGVTADVIHAVRHDAGGALLLRGVARARLVSVSHDGAVARTRVESLREEVVSDVESDALFANLRHAVREIMGQVGVPVEVAAQVEQLPTAGALADFVAARLESSVADKAELLGMLNVKARTLAVLTRVVRRSEVLKIRQSIDAQIHNDMGKQQREHILREQRRAIEKELGESRDGEAEDDLDALEKRVAGANLPDEARAVADKQVKRLRTLQSGSPELTTTRAYLEWILDLPWTSAGPSAAAGAGQGTPDIGAVRAALDADHHGLEKVKRRILEYLAVQKLKSDKKGPILCLIGPPGVGKTSLGRSIAGALGRKFQRISLGGVHDEAAIRGHRRTYVGALPGNILHGLKKAGVSDPVFMLDEIDKLGEGRAHGDPSAALLEVLDPEQNGAFTDHYLEIPFDLSNIMFIATANVGEPIPEPLRDRMEIIEIPGYTRLEKLVIARRHLVPKELVAHGITPDHLAISDEALLLIIDRYTREAGVRSLEKQIATIARGVAVRLSEGGTGAVLVHNEDDVRSFLGPAHQEDPRAERTSEAGIATGLAWTPAGGQILLVEAARMKGRGKLTLTGQLGDVMRESGMAALSFVRANAQRWGIPFDFLDRSDIHIHVPAGATPKDGPSAGVTVVTAIVSLLTSIPVRHDVAMTGEITLRGRVLPIGGFKEKVLAAHRAGIKVVVAPKRNAADLDDVPDEVKREIQFVFVSTIGEVIDAALDRSTTGPQHSEVSRSGPNRLVELSP